MKYFDGSSCFLWAAEWQHRVIGMAVTTWQSPLCSAGFSGCAFCWTVAGMCIFAPFLERTGGFKGYKYTSRNNFDKCTTLNPLASAVEVDEWQLDWDLVWRQCFCLTHWCFPKELFLPPALSASGNLLIDHSQEYIFSCTLSKLGSLTHVWILPSWVGVFCFPYLPPLPFYSRNF